MENENMVAKNPEELTKEQRAKFGALVLDFVLTGIKFIDWEETEKDFFKHHSPEDYGLTAEEVEEIIGIFNDGCDEADLDELKSQPFYADMFQGVFNQVIDHEIEQENEESQQLN